LVDTFGELNQAALDLIESPLDLLSRDRWRLGRRKRRGGLGPTLPRR
jgi:hypothetical protein